MRLDMKEEEIFSNMFRIDGSSDLIDEIEGIIDDEDTEVNEENTPVKLRKKYRKEIDSLFTTKSMTCQDLFSLAFLIISEFNINPESFFMCLSKENRVKLRNYANNNFDTSYHLKKEKMKKLEKRIKKGKSIDEEAIDMRDLFL
jgi:hypothetical protein